MSMNGISRGLSSDRNGEHVLVEEPVPATGGGDRELVLDDQRLRNDIC
jgi:hypothetical protein